MTESATLHTRQRLLEAAGEVFAERGFRATTVRAICQRAGANVAAVNYYFGDKERLYAAVLLYAHRCSVEQYPPDLGVHTTSTPAERLYAFIHSFLLRIFAEGRPAWHGKLMAREMVEPTQALATLVATEIRPMASRLEGLVHTLLGDRASTVLVQRCAMSIVSQCIFYHHARPVLTQLYPMQQYDSATIAALAQHITQFSLVAMQGLAHSTEEPTA